MCSAQRRNRYNSEVVLHKIGILTLPGEVRIPTLRGSIPELSLRKVEIEDKVRIYVSFLFFITSDHLYCYLSINLTVETD